LGQLRRYRQTVVLGIAANQRHAVRNAGRTHLATCSRLDARGNSRRGIEVVPERASRFGLDTFDCLNVGSSFLSTMSSPRAVLSRFGVDLRLQTGSA